MIAAEVAHAFGGAAESIERLYAGDAA